MIFFKNRGSFANTQAFLKRASKDSLFSNLDAYGQRGVDALASGTPRKTGLTAASWKYRITQSKGYIHIEWYNTNQREGEEIAILIQYGHGTGTGGYIQGVDYINPAIKPIFEEISNEIWGRLTNG